VSNMRRCPTLVRLVSEEPDKCTKKFVFSFASTLLGSDTCIRLIRQWRTTAKTSIPKQFSFSLHLRHSLDTSQTHQRCVETMLINDGAFETDQ
jgi:hypothetical protein